MVFGLLSYFICSIQFTYHGSDLIKALKKLNDLAFVGGLDTCITASLTHSFSLLVQWQVIKLTASESTACHILIITEDANTAADSHSGTLVITWEGEKLRIIQIFRITALF